MTLQLGTLPKNFFQTALHYIIDQKHFPISPTYNFCMTRIEAEAVTTAAHKQKKKVKQQLIGCICASHGRQPAGIIKVGGALKCLTRGRSVVVFRVPFFFAALPPSLCGCYLPFLAASHPNRTIRPINLARNCDFRSFYCIYSPAHSTSAHTITSSSGSRPSESFCPFLVRWGREVWVQSVRRCS